MIGSIHYILELVSGDMKYSWTENMNIVQFQRKMCRKFYEELVIETHENGNLETLSLRTAPAVS